MKKLRVVEITWGDAWNNARDQWSREELAREAPCTLIDVGYLVADNKRQISIGTEFNPKTDMFRHVIVIPKSCIQKTRYLK